MNRKRLRDLARRHAAGHPSRTCSHEAESTPCDAHLLAAEIERMAAWADFASDLLDAHIFGFGPGDWQAADALAHLIAGDDWPPEWHRDLEDAAHIIVDPQAWPISGEPERDGSGRPLTDATYRLLAEWAERGFEEAQLKARPRP
jgi:hypothetical protein